VKGESSESWDNELATADVIVAQVAGVNTATA
jgi:hypothetical protein